MKYRIIVCEPGKDPVIEEAENPFKRARELTKGSIEMVALDDGVTLMLDEDGISKNLPFNRLVPATGKQIPEGVFVIMVHPDPAPPGDLGVHKVRGTFVLTRHDFIADVPISLTNDDIEHYTGVLRDPVLRMCPQCGRPPATSVHIYCGAACSARAECHELPQERR